MRRDQLADFCKLNLLYDTDLSTRVLKVLVRERIYHGYDLLQRNTLHTGLGIVSFKEIAQLLDKYNLPYSTPEESRWYHYLHDRVQNIFPEIFDHEQLEKIASKIIHGSYYNSNPSHIPPYKRPPYEHWYVTNDDYNYFFRCIDNVCNVPHIPETPDVETVHSFLYRSKDHETDIQRSEGFIASSKTAQAIYSICQNSDHDPTFARYLELRKKYLFDVTLHTSRPNGVTYENPAVSQGLWAKFTAAALPENENLQKLFELTKRINRVWIHKNLSQTQLGFQYALIK